MKQSNKNADRKPKVANPQKRDFDLANRMINATMGLGRSYMRRLCAVNVLTTNGSGVLPFQYLADSTQISSLADFSATAALYTQYRAVAVRVTLMPYFPVNTTGVVVPATVIAAPFRGGLAPASLVQFMESTDRTIMSGYKQYVLTTHFQGDNDAHLWTQTTAAISATESYGLVILGQSVGATANTNVWNLLVEWLVEFRVSG